TLNVDIEKRLKLLKKSFTLTNIEIEIVTFFYLLTMCGLVDNYLSTGLIANYQSVSNFRRYGHIILGLKKGSFLQAFSEKRLFQTYIIEIDVRHIELTSWCLDYLTGHGEEDLSHEFFTKENDEILQLSDFNILDNEKIVLETLIKNKSGQNILFYGVPGTGKSSLARCLAKTFKKKLFTVKPSQTDKHKDRLLAISATINLAERNKTIVLVDESDEVLNTRSSFSFRSTTNKSWINNLLEGHQKKVIWITNRSNGIDSSTMRRFTFSVEFKKFDTKDRLNVLNKELKRQELDNYFSGDDLHDLCRTYSVNAGGIIDAIKILKVGKKTRKETALRKIKTLLRNHEKVTTGMNNRNTTSGKFNNYSLSGLNTSQNLDNVVSVLKKYTEYQYNSAENPHSIKMLLYGMPGTGKSEFVYYLGNLLSREVLLKRCSAIQSMWVGETEKNIAEAFCEAQENNSILFFDEADSLLYPRKEANRSWEKSMTNEILTQMDSYTGIVVFATNDVGGLDHAAFRRFQFKIEFLPLTPEGNVQFYSSILNPLISKNNILTDDDVHCIRNMRNLTPGDFAVVKEQYTFTSQSKVTHQQLIESLLNETRHKESEKRITGFAVMDR
ncbi:MAG: AAA family ATPase, partial [Candidatus Scalindua sp.]